MLQQLALDRSRWRSYYALGLVAVSVGACGGGPAPLVPEALPPLADTVAARWVAESVPTGARKYDMRWLYETQQGQSRGRAVVRFVPPDSLRLDVRAPFGRSGAAVAIGDSVRWSEPDDGVRKLMPVVPLFWAVLGIPHLPGREPGYTGEERARARVLRYAVQGDTLTYVLWLAQPRLQLEVRRDGRTLGTVDVELAPSGRVPDRATMRFPQDAALVVFTVSEIEEITGVDPDIWKEPEDTEEP